MSEVLNLGDFSPNPNYKKYTSTIGSCQYFIDLPLVKMFSIFAEFKWTGLKNHWLTSVIMSLMIFYLFILKQFKTVQLNVQYTLYGTIQCLHILIIKTIFY